MGYLVYKCDECCKLLLSDGEAFLAHKKTKHDIRGYGESKVIAVIEDGEKKYEFRDTPQEKRLEWIKTNGAMRPRRIKKVVQKVYVINQICKT